MAYWEVTNLDSLGEYCPPILVESDDPPIGDRTVDCIELRPVEGDSQLPAVSVDTPMPPTVSPGDEGELTVGPGNRNNQFFAKFGFKDIVYFVTQGEVRRDIVRYVTFRPPKELSGIGYSIITYYLDGIAESANEIDLFFTKEDAIINWVKNARDSQVG